MNNLNDFYRLFPNRPALAEQPAAPVAPQALPAIPAAAIVAVEAAPSQPRYRQRGYGTGYGRSSGYAQDRSYADQNAGRLLRVC